MELNTIFSYNSYSFKIYSSLFHGLMYTSEVYLTYFYVLPLVFIYPTEFLPLTSVAPTAEF